MSRQNTRSKRRKVRLKINYKRFIPSILIIFLCFFLLFKITTSIASLFSKNPQDGSKNKKSSEASENFLSKEKWLEDYEFLKEKYKNHPYLESLKATQKVDLDKINQDYDEKFSNASTDEEFISLLTDYSHELKDKDSFILSLDQYDMYRNVYLAESLWGQVLRIPDSTNLYHSFRLKRDESISSVPIKSSSSAITFEKNKDNKAAFIKFNNFDEANITKDKQAVADFLKDSKDLEKLILDIRGVSKGSDLYWINVIAKNLAREDLYFTGRILQNDDYFDDYIKTILRNNGSEIKISEKYPINELPSEYEYPDYVKKFKNFYRYDISVKALENPVFNGKIIIAMDQSVYGPADSLVQFAKATGFATCFGQASSGGGGNAGIDPVFVKLPKSGLILRMPAVLGLNNFGQVLVDSKTSPDILLEHENFKLETILTYTMEKIDETSENTDQ